MDIDELAILSAFMCSTDSIVLTMQTYDEPTLYAFMLGFDAKFRINWVRPGDKGD